MKKKIGIILGTALAAIVGFIAVCYGIYTNVKGASSISLIGGADGPTSVFLAGRINSGYSIIFMIAGVLALLLALFLIIGKRK